MFTTELSYLNFHKLELFLSTAITNLKSMEKTYIRLT